MPEQSKQGETLRVFDMLRREGKPSREPRYLDQEPTETGEPVSEQEQAEFDADMKRRTEQDLLNRTDMQEPLRSGYRAAARLTGDVAPGETGVGTDVATPYAADYFERRRRQQGKPTL